MALLDCGHAVTLAHNDFQSLCVPKEIRSVDKEDNLQEWIDRRGADP